MPRENVYHTKIGDYSLSLNILENDKSEVCVENDYRSGFISKEFDSYNKAEKEYQKIATSKKKQEDYLISFINDNSELKDITEKLTLEQKDTHHFIMEIHTKDGGYQYIELVLNDDFDKIDYSDAIFKQNEIIPVDTFQTHKLLQHLHNNFYYFSEISALAKKFESNDALENLIKEFDSKNDNNFKDSPFNLVSNKIEKEKKVELFSKGFLLLLDNINGNDLDNIMNNYHTPNELLKAVIETEKDFDLNTYKSILKNPNITIDDVKFMSKSDCDIQRVAVAEDFPLYIDELNDDELQKRIDILSDMTKDERNFGDFYSISKKAEKTIENINYYLKEENRVLKVHEVSQKEHYEDEDKKINKKNKNRG